MKLDKLRGFGPWFAFATPAFFALSVVALSVLGSSVRVTGDTATYPDWFPVGVAVWLILLALFMISGLVVAIDLEWIEHPRTHTGLTYVALGSMAVSTIAFLFVLLLGALNISGWILPVSATLWFCGLGLYLILINLVAARAKLLGGVLPVFGMVGGALWVIVGLSLAVSAVLGPLAALGFLFILAAVPIYLFWSLWLGFKLWGKAPAEAAPAA